MTDEQDKNKVASEKIGAFVDEEICIGCTLCTQICPNVFTMTDEGKSRATNPTGDSQDKIQQAIDSCPVSCIKFKKI
ncbi:ferredoxin [Candidatus Peregrinibacteria bacterium]|nr:ferredoxin [Candidatus Peregrinibacteria bacterium]